MGTILRPLSSSCRSEAAGKVGSPMTCRSVNTISQAAMASISNARAAILKRFDVRSGKWIISGVLMAISTRQLGPSGASSRADLCKRGFAGGQVNGHQRDGRYGIFCFRRGAQWLQELVEDLQHHSRRQSLRIGCKSCDKLCRARDFQGRFMNGHQIPGRYGAVCQK